jgi:quercetin dioxygenase-like cupin family protein
MSQLISSQGKSVQPAGPAAALNVVHRAQVAAMPTGRSQEVRVITGELKPGEQTPRHSHRFPVIVYVLEGSFSLDLADGQMLVAKAGEALIEPPHVAMVGHNKTTGTVRLVMTYVSDPDVPFADLAS